MVFVSLGVALVLLSSKLHGSCSVMGLLLLVSLCWVFLLYSVSVWVLLLVLKVFFRFFAMFMVCFKLSFFFFFFSFFEEHFKLSLPVNKLQPCICKKNHMIHFVLRACAHIYMVSLVLS